MSARALYLKSAYVVLTVWPLVHMLLALFIDFSPWKFMGWGMYATPYPELQQVVAFKKPLACRARSPLAQDEARPAIEPRPALASPVFELYDWQPRRVQRVPSLLPEQESLRFFEALRSFSVWNTEASFERALARLHPSQPVLLAAIRPRISLERKLFYWDVSLYRYEDRHVRLVSHHEAGDVDPLLRIGRELGCTD